MKKQEILKDFIKYCYDLKLDEKKKSTKTKYINAAMKYFTEFQGIRNFEEKQKELENILKYNPLSIEKIKKDYIKELKQLPF